MFNVKRQFKVTKLVSTENCDGTEPQVLTEKYKGHGAGMPHFSTCCQDRHESECKAFFYLQIIMRTRKIGGRSNETND